MKKTFLITLLTLICAVCFAQDVGTLKFLGIPIDGSKAQLIEKIKEKGFRSVSYSEGLKGQFNGENVEVYVVDNHGIAYRVFVAFPKTSEYEIRSEFNHLLNQFLRNKKYIPTREYDVIPEGEDISYEILVNKKRYGASFVYISPDIFTDEQAEKIHEVIDKAKTMSEDEKKSLSESFALAFASDSGATTPEDALVILNKIKSLVNANVWFTILQDAGDYKIGLYYDNLKNAPNGEDL